MTGNIDAARPVDIWTATPARYGSRQIRACGFASPVWHAAVVAALTLLAAGTVKAQTAPAPPPMPSIIYPDRDPDTAPPGRPPPAQYPPPTVDNGAPVTYQVVDGVWGFWDRGHHFHPRLAASVRRPEERTLVPGFAPAQANDGRRVGDPRLAVREAPHFLPRPAPGGIVVHSPSPRERISHR